jgi:hypothetical protein
MLSFAYNLRVQEVQEFKVQRSKFKVQSSRFKVQKGERVRRGM